VHIINVSVTGAIASEVVANQLPRIKGLKPDLVTLDIGANDINKKIPAEEFAKNFRTILAAIPTKNTIVADLPTFERGPKQATLIAVNDMIHPIIAEYGFQLSPIYQFTSVTIHDWTTYAADFFHPSDKGYRNWFASFETKLDSVIQQ
jgi:acyl-CoA thioesterase-1